MCGHEDHAGVGAGGLDGLLAGVEDRHAEHFLAALAGGHAGDDLGAVLHHLLGVEAAFAAGEALDDDFRLGVDKDAHYALPVISAILRAASDMEAAGW